MAYDDHPLYSDLGIQILKDIYSGLYKKDSNGEITKDLQTNVVHFNNNKVGIVYNLRKFLASTTRIPIPDTQDSGIYMCDPLNGGCGRRSFMYDWEFVDFGVYGTFQNWLGNVSLDQVPYRNNIGFMIMCRVRCNNYSQCNECHQTWSGHSSNCIYCSSSSITTGGCGNEAWTSHIVKERTAENISAENREAIKPVQLMEITSAGKIVGREVNSSGIFAFRITYNGPATNQVNTYDDAVRHIPNLEVGYQLGAYRKPYGFTCNTCQHERYFPPPTAAHPFGAPMEERNIDSNFSYNLTSPQTGGIYQGIGMNANTNTCTEAGCGGTYLPNMSWDIGRPKVLGPMDQYNAEYQQGCSQQQFARSQNALPVKYPISAMRWSFTMDPKIMCGTCSSGRRSRYAVSIWNVSPSNRCLNCNSWNKGAGTNCYLCQNNGLTLGDRNTPTTYAVEFFPANTRLLFCPSCGPTNTDVTKFYTDEYTSGRPYLFPRVKLVIINPQPLLAGTTDQVLTFGNQPRLIANQPVYLINLNSTNANDYRYQMYLPVTYSTTQIPTNLDDIKPMTPSGAGSEPCPHDTMFNPPPIPGSTSPPPTPAGQGCCVIGATQMLTDENTCLNMGGVFQGVGSSCINPGTTTVSGNTISNPCEGVTLDGISYMIAEGRSHHAYKNLNGTWIDQSIDNRSYRNPNTGAAGSSLITYARFSQGVAQDPRTQGASPTLQPAANYRFCDPRNSNTGILSDPYHKSALAQIQGGSGGTSSSNLGVTTHALSSIGKQEDVNYGWIELITCNTCVAISEAGMKLAKSGDPKGRGTPFPKVAPADWVSCGGAANLQDAWTSSPQKYHPGMGVLLYRTRLGQIQITGWSDDMTPTCNFPRPMAYTNDCLRGELAIEQNGFTASPTGSESIPCPGGWWNWALDSGGRISGDPGNPCESWRIKSARGDTIVM